MIRLAACSLPIALGDPLDNARAIAAHAAELAKEGVALALYPRNALAGNSLGALDAHAPLLDATHHAITELCAATESLPTALVVGAPLLVSGTPAPCALVIVRGQVTHVVSLADTFGPVSIGGLEASPSALFRLGESDSAPCFAIGWPQAQFELSEGPRADVVLELAGEQATAGAFARQRTRLEALSAEYSCAWVYASTGAGESSTDGVYSASTFIAEAGQILDSGPFLAPHASAALADIDLDVMRAGARSSSQWGVETISYDSPSGDFGLRRPLSRFPLVAPTAEADVASLCEDVTAIQVRALSRRLEAIGQPKVVIGVSGGLDSTQALLVAARAMDEAGRERSDILAYTLPGFATSEATKANATRLAKAIGATFEEIDIRPAAQQMLADMGHPAADGEAVYDVTFENVQAGLRTDYLFRLANHHGGLVLGTGDASEAALGWCTYGVGDHMSHYNVNPGVPKTLMRALVRQAAASGEWGSEASAVLTDILNTEISPELIPAGSDGALQSTQSTIGPYELHDFFLAHVLRYRMSPAKIAFLASHAWGDAKEGFWPAGEDTRHEYSLAEIRQWLDIFCRRFFSQQYKRSASVDGPMVLEGISLSPRTGLAMPSDASPAAWLASLEDIPEA